MHADAISLGLQVATFGSVPLRTYLPDGDIDLCLVGSSELLLNDSWAEKLRAVLDSRCHSGNTEVAVTEVQIIHAEVLNGSPAARPARQGLPSTLGRQGSGAADAFPTPPLDANCR